MDKVNNKRRVINNKKHGLYSVGRKIKVFPSTVGNMVTTCVPIVVEEPWDLSIFAQIIFLGLQSFIVFLLDKIAILSRRIDLLVREARRFENMDKENTELKKRNLALKEKLSKHENPKNICNR